MRTAGAGVNRWPERAPPEIAHKTIAPITQDRFQEADLECVAQIDDAKPPSRVTPAGITEPARRLSIS